MATKFNPFGTATTVEPFNVIKDLTDQVQGGAITLNKKGDTAPLREGNGTAGIEVNLSVRSGGESKRGSARMNLRGDQVGTVLEALSSFELSDEPNLSDLTPEECIRHSIQVERPKGEEPVVSFKLSLKDHARSIRIPLDQWSDFLGFMSSLSEWTENAASYYLEVIQKQEAAKSEEDRKESERKASGKSEAK